MLLLRGQRDTRKPMFPDGTPNPLGNQDYEQITYEEIWRRLFNPQQVEKSEGDAVIPSEYVGPDGRIFGVQQENGVFPWMSIDIDEGGHSKQDIINAMDRVFPGVFYMTWETYSSMSPEKGGGKRWRVFVQLTPISGIIYKAAVLAARSLLATAGGLAHSDRTSARFAQISFLPNRGPYSYDFHVQTGMAFDVRTPYFAHELQRQYEMDVRPNNVGAPDRLFTAIWNFNKAYPTEDLFQLYGYSYQPGSGQWKNPDQSASSPHSIRVFDDGGWTAYGETMASIGKSNRSQAFGDAFDIFVHHCCRGNRALAERAAKAIQYGAVTTHPDPYYLVQQADACLKYHELKGAELWTAYQVLEQKAKDANVPEIDDDEPIVTQKDRFTNLPMPEGAIGRIAQWVHDDFMKFPHWGFAIASAWVIAGALAGRKDNFRDSAPRFSIVMMGINAAGKNTPSKALRTLLEDFINRNADRSGYEGLVGYADRMSPKGKTFGATEIVQDMLMSPSLCMIWSEDGVASNSRAGDDASIRASLMQDMMEDAYSRSSIRASKMIKARPWGVNFVRLRESTKEAMQGHLKGSSVQTGEVSRELLLHFDVSGSTPVNDMPVHKRVPDDVAQIIENLIIEAYRDELINPETGYMTERRLPEHSLRTFVADQEADAYFQEMYRTTVKARANNRNNEANMEWALVNRAPQYMQILSLVVARTNQVAYGGPCHVTMKDVRTAEGLWNESARVYRANQTDYENVFDRLILTMLNRMREMAKDPPKQLIGAYKVPKDMVIGRPTPAVRKKVAQAALTEGYFPISYFKRGRSMPVKNIAATISDSEGRFRGATPSSVIEAIALDRSGLEWDYEKDSRFGPCLRIQI